MDDVWISVKVAVQGGWVFVEGIRLVVCGILYETKKGHQFLDSLPAYIEFVLGIGGHHNLPLSQTMGSISSREVPFLVLQFSKS